jgi:hypothetical protein
MFPATYIHFSKMSSPLFAVALSSKPEGKTEEGIRQVFRFKV